MDLFAVNRGDEGDVNGLVALVRHAVSSALGIIHFLVVLGTQVQVVVIGHQTGKRMRRFDDAVGMLVEHFKKIAFTRQQLPKQHRVLLISLYVNQMTHF